MPDKIPHNFGGLQPKFCNYKKSAVAILPIPFDKTSTWGKGANKGPRAIIEASGNMELYDIETDSEVYKKGIFTAPPVLANNTKMMIAKGCETTKKLIADGKFVVTIGGEHSVALGPIMAHKESCPNMSILHLDAHSDRRDIYEDDKNNHACVMARAQERVKNIVSVGVRSMDSSEKKKTKRDTIIYALEIAKSTNWIKNAIKPLTDEVYITIDLDIFDPGFMPSTGTPEPGGLNWYQVIDLIKEVAMNKKIIGFDVVELCPTTNNKAPDFLAAKLIYTTLSHIFKSKT